MDNPGTSGSDTAELHTVRQLAMAAGVAALVWAVLLLTAVLPAELGVDPTGLGTQMGLTQMGLVKTAPAVEVPKEAPFEQRTDTVTLTLTPKQGAEIKAVMRAGDAMRYSWSADKGPVFFEFHGDPKGRPGSEFTSYEKATKQRARGDFEAEFDGKHGWYWKNKNSETVTITLETTGVYQSVSVQ